MCVAGGTDHEMRSVLAGIELECGTGIHDVPVPAQRRQRLWRKTLAKEGGTEPAWPPKCICIGAKSLGREERGFDARRCCAAAMERLRHAADVGLYAARARCCDADGMSEVLLAEAEKRRARNR